MKTALLIICACALLGCASGIRETYTAYHDQCVRQWGPENAWTPSQSVSYIEGLKELRDRQTDQQAAWARLGAGLQTTGAQMQGQSYTDPSLLQNLKASQQQNGSGFRSWHNSDGTSGQYVPYPGGNGGTIYNSNGTLTNVDPAIGQ